MNVRYSYDLRGLQTRAWFTGNDWGISNAWDGFGRLVSTTSNIGGPVRTVSHRFDREGRRIELAFPDGLKFWTAATASAGRSAIIRAPTARPRTS
jgi:hypothetical protein